MVVFCIIKSYNTVDREDICDRLVLKKSVRRNKCVVTYKI